MVVAFFDSLSVTAACTYSLLYDISPWLGQLASATLSANVIMLAFAGYLYTQH